MTEHLPPHPDLSNWVGRQETSMDIASAQAALRLSAVLDTAPAPTGASDAPLFPLGHFLNFNPTARMSELGVDGHPLLGDFMPPIDLPRRMWAGSKIDFATPIFAGQQLKRTTTIESVTPKTGSSGRLCFVVLLHQIHSEGKLAITERQTLVYREASEIDPAAPSPQKPARPDVEAPLEWDWVRSERPTETTLFRYSALTFNTHRIHYDLPYATEVEGYPGLVVHGPLLATYLMNAFLINHPGASPKSFEFSARAPLFAGELIHLVGRSVGIGVEELAVVGPSGSPSLTARIEFDVPV